MTDSSPSPPDKAGSSPAPPSDVSSPSPSDAEQCGGFALRDFVRWILPESLGTDPGAMLAVRASAVAVEAIVVSLDAFQVSFLAARMQNAREDRSIRTEPEAAALTLIEGSTNAIIDTERKTWSPPPTGLLWLALESPTVTEGQRTAAAVALAALWLTPGAATPYVRKHLGDLMEALREDERYPARVRLLLDDAREGAPPDQVFAEARAILATLEEHATPVPLEGPVSPVPVSRTTPEDLEREASRLIEGAAVPGQVSSGLERQIARLGASGCVFVTLKELFGLKNDSGAPIASESTIRDMMKKSQIREGPRNKKIRSWDLEGALKALAGAKRSPSLESLAALVESRAQKSESLEPLRDFITGERSARPDEDRKRLQSRGGERFS